MLVGVPSLHLVVLEHHSDPVNGAKRFEDLLPWRRGLRRVQSLVLERAVLLMTASPLKLRHRGLENGGSKSVSGLLEAVFFDHVVQVPRL